MQQFIAGFISALLAVVSLVIVMLYLRKNRRTPDKAGRNVVPVRENCNHSKSTNDEQVEELGKLIGELAHEIKNPLSTIKLNLKLIGEDLQGSNVSEQGGPAARDNGRFARAMRKITVVQKEAERLQQILDGFLKYFDRTNLEPARLDINELVGDMFDFYSPQAYSHSITMRQTLHPEPLFCRVDAGMLKQVLLNLFINAQQAMADGGELMVRTEKQNDSALIKISDTGCGIPPEKLPHIFTAYYTSRSRGSGLGLPTAKKIIDAHKGTIEVDSVPGKGTSFTITLPLCQ